MTKVIVTLGPSTNTFEKVSMIKSKGVDFVRINMSHSTLEDLNLLLIHNLITLIVLFI